MTASLSNYTKKELNKKLKTQKKMFLIQVFVILLMVVFAVFSSIENGISIHTFLPLFFSPMCLVMLFEIKKLKKEVALKDKK